jgi:hypothetical protein
MNPRHLALLVISSALNLTVFFDTGANAFSSLFILVEL